MKMRRLRKNIKAISPIISVLLMIAVAVVAALVTYAWVMGFIGFQTGKTGKAIQIQSMYVDPVTRQLTVYVQNVGDSTLKVSPTQAVYVNGTMAASPGSEITLNQGDTGTIVTTNPTIPANSQATVKVTSEDGTFSQVTQTFP